MMQIGRMHMRVGHRLMCMPMRVRLDPVPRKVVRVPMMLVVPVRMIVRESLMGVAVAVSLGQMQPHAERDQRQCDPECAIGLLGQHGECDGDTEEAVGILQNAVNRYPGDEQLWIGLGNALVDHARGLTPPPADTGDAQCG